MEKYNADVMALNFAIRIAETDPAFFAANGDGTHKAGYVADFIKTLSSRLEEEISDGIHMGDIKPR